MDKAIHSETTIGPVHLAVADLGRSLQFYEHSLGLGLHRRETGHAVLGTSARELLVLTEQPGARAVRGVTGLYHYALLTPSRPELARAFRRLVATEAPLSGFSDHGVSEAIYLSDPDGHGIEVYRDRPRHEWPFQAGRLVMTTERLDIDGLLAEVDSKDEISSEIAPETTMGHIHLHVNDLAAARGFYVDVLGFELMASYGPSALFVAAGGYHHHIGLNTWAGVGVPPPPVDAVRLKWYEILLPSHTALTEVKQRIQNAGLALDTDNGHVSVKDPSGNGIILTVENNSSRM